MGFLADDFLLGIFLCKDFHCFEGTYLSFLIPSYPLSSCIQFLRWYLHTTFHTFRLVLCWARFCVWNLGFVESNFLTLLGLPVSGGVLHSSLPPPPDPPKGFLLYLPDNF